MPLSQEFFLTHNELIDRLGFADYGLRITDYGMSRREEMSERTDPFQRKQIGLGTFPFSNVFSKITQSDAEKVVEKFINLGERYIETAPMYPRLTVDLGAKRSDYLLGSKCVLYRAENGEVKSSGTSNSI